MQNLSKFYSDVGQIFFTGLTCDNGFAPKTVVYKARIYLVSRLPHGFSFKLFKVQLKEILVFLFTNEPIRLTKLKVKRDLKVYTHIKISSENSLVFRTISLRII
jgi:hypothetical protein